MKRTFLLLGLLMTLGSASVLCAQQTGYFQTNLVSNTAGVAATTDTQLLNPWGISILPGQDFWVANNNGGTSTLYDPQGNKPKMASLPTGPAPAALWWPSITPPAARFTKVSPC